MRGRTHMDRIPEPALLVRGHALVPITAGDAEELQRFFEACSEYFELQDGCAPGGTAALDELAQVPPERSAADKLSLGVRAPGGDLVGFVDLVRHYPEPGCWWLGLLLLVPRLRNRGLGAQVYEELARWAAAHGACSIRLGVLEQNRAAQRFWRRRGFEPVGSGRYVAPSGRESAVIIMAAQLARSGTLPEGPHGA